MASIYEYSIENFIFKTTWCEHEMSHFDETLTRTWTMMQDQEGFFRYNFKIDDSKTLPGKHKYLAQLNLARAHIRRKPAEIQSMNQQFNPNTFNFTKMDRKEILFEIINKKRKNMGNYVAINVSPLEFGHCLFLPALNMCLPQVVTFDSLLDAVELFLLSKSPAMRMGFNGLCAYASLNHLHFHIYYLEHQMPLETIEVEHLAGPCHVLQSFPSQGFAFQMSEGENIEDIVKNVFKLISFLQENEKPYNVFITRGSSFQDKCSSLTRNHVRVYVWTRKPVYGHKGLSTFNPALCEMFGHLLIKNKEDYESLTEEYVTSIMSDLTKEPFQSVVDQVRELFNSCDNDNKI